MAIFAGLTPSAFNLATSSLPARGRHTALIAIFTLGFGDVLPLPLERGFTRGRRPYRLR
jgi:hypothetical protein